MIVYRLLEERDLEERVKWMNDERIWKSMRYDLPITLERTQIWFDSVSNNPNRLDTVIEVDGELAVMNGLTERDTHGMARSYTFVNPDLKGKGLGSLSLSLKCGTGFYAWGLRKQWTYIDFDNEISKRLCERVGFREEGVHRAEGFRNNQYFDLSYYGMLETDFNRKEFDKYMSQCDNRVWKGLMR